MALSLASASAQIRRYRQGWRGWLVFAVSALLTVAALALWRAV